MRMVTILVVEDTHDLAETISKELQLSGYQVIIADNGLDALTCQHKHRADLIILDWMLPALNGLEVLRQIRQSFATPVLMLTARDDEADRVLGLEVGADDYLTKPFSMRELIMRVRAMLRRVELIRQTLEMDRKTSDESIRYAALCLDPIAHSATLADVSIELSRIEFDLLSLFIRNPGRAFGRAYLLEMVWGTLPLDGDRAVDNTVLRLRRKLGALGEAIETVRGVGYRLRTASE